MTIVLIAVLLPILYQLFIFFEKTFDNHRVLFRSLGILLYAALMVAAYLHSQVESEAKRVESEAKQARDSVDRQMVKGSARKSDTVMQQTMLIKALTEIILKKNTEIERNSQLTQTIQARLLNPLEKLQMNYVLQIPASQKGLQEYKKRILTKDPCPKCNFINLSDRDWLPDQNRPCENLFAWFLMDIFTTISFKKPSSDDFDGRSDFLMRSSASTSIEEITESKTDSSLEDKVKLRINLYYSKKDDSFYVEINDPNPFQTHSLNMFSFKDFPGKEVLLEVEIGVSLEAQLTRDYINMLRSIDFKIFDAMLRSENYIRKIEIHNFKPAQNTGVTRRFKSKLASELSF